MSIASWKEEFYPVDASLTSKEEAVEHSLRKWEGLSPENMLKHGVTRSRDRVNLIEDDHRMFGIDSTTCSLCHHYDKVFGEDALGCMGCPIVEETGARCYRRGEPYDAWYNRNDSVPMRALLRRIHEKQQRQG